MANLVTNSAQIQVSSVEDTTSTVLVTRTAIPSLDVLTSGGMFYVATPDAASHVINFPLGVTIVKHLYIRNTGSGSQSLLVTWAPNGGAAVTIALLGPGDVLVYWQDSLGAPLVTAINQGLTSLSVQSNVAGVTYEYFLGA
jgi:hypothetical protein